MIVHVGQLKWQLSFNEFLSVCVCHRGGEILCVEQDASPVRVVTKKD